MRISPSVLSVLLLLINWTGQARADLFVASSDSFQVLRYDSSTGAPLGAFAVGLPNDRPLGMTIGPDGNLYVGMVNFVPTSVSVIRRFDKRTGALIDTFASGGGLSGPSHLVFGPDGNLYVASFGGLADKSKVVRYNGTTGVYIDDFVPVGSGGLKGAEGLVFGPDGNLYVTSRVTNQVLRYDGATGTFLGVFATGGQNGPVDLVFGPDGNLYVLTPLDDNLEVLRFEGMTGAFIDVFARGVFDDAVVGSDGSSLVFGPDGNLCVTTTFLRNSVQRFDGATGQFLDEFVPRGSGGLAEATGLLFFTPLPFCGNAVVEEGEQCDDGNTRSGDGCSATCQRENPPTFDCSTATASVDFPQLGNRHRYAVTIQGVTAPPDDTISLTINSIFQDEPVTSPTGKTCPDGIGVGTAVAKVRNERIITSAGDGRVYHIGFTATNEAGASCTGEVQVCVPVKEGEACGDQGVLFDSTVCP